ncbi:MAG TPA: class I SAM-dependent methyltransferase [Novosphingobium sp.]
MTEQPTQASQFDAYAGSYDEAVNKSLGFLGVKVDYFTRVKAGYLLDLLAAHFGRVEDLRLLDVGCGVGNYHALLDGRLGAISGTDVSPACVAEAAARNPGVAYQPYDGERLPYAEASFDAVVTICVMHHVPPPQWPMFAAEMKRVLRPGGLAVVFEHNPINPLTQRVVSNCEFDADAVLLKQGETRRLLEGAGFGKVASRSILSLPSFGPVTRKFDLAFGRLPLGAQYFASGVA